MYLRALMCMNACVKIFHRRSINNKALDTEVSPGLEFHCNSWTSWRNEQRSCEFCQRVYELQMERETRETEVSKAIDTRFLLLYPY